MQLPTRIFQRFAHPSMKREEPPSSESPRLCRKSNGLSNFITVYFNFAYYLLCSPFCFESDEHGWFNIRTTLPQKIMCGAMNSIGVVHMVSAVNFLYSPTVGNPSPLKYFQFFRRVFAFWFQGLTVKRFWCNQNEFLELVNSTRRQCRMLSATKLKILNKNFSRFLCSLFAVMPLYEIIWKKCLADYNTWHETIWNRNLVTEGRNMFLLSNNHTSQSPSLEELSLLDPVLALFMAVGWIERYLFGYYIDLSLLFIVLTVWSTTYIFANTLEADNTSETLVSFRNHTSTSMKEAPPKLTKCTWPEVYRTYQSIREFCHLINSVWGTLITIYLADAIMFYSLSVDSVFLLTEIPEKVRLIFFICNSTVVCVLSADACHQMDALKMWLTNEENRKDIPMDQLNVVLNELEYRFVGIRGSDAFTITYSLLWNVITTVVTYFIICLQTRLQEDHSLIDASAHAAIANCTKIAK